MKLFFQVTFEAVIPLVIEAAKESIAKPKEINVMVAKCMSVIESAGFEILYSCRLEFQHTLYVNIVLPLIPGGFPSNTNLHARSQVPRPYG